MRTLRCAGAIELMKNVMRSESSREAGEDFQTGRLERVREVGKEDWECGKVREDFLS
ncbi:hypothetical protein [Methanocella arvoryzae]|uniref:hypothetical protein n=1 Tax=Methanocella arvoryzae TaxID=1175445 RepID=UPI00130524D4|nr:hypothetical protein [Methanocella arvoryzae]